MNASAKRLLPLLAALAAACTPSLAERYAAGNSALSTSEGAMYFVVISPRLQSALNECIPPGTPGAAPVVVLVADVDASGAAHDLDVTPHSAGTRCVRQRLAEQPLPRPPLAPGATRFPIGLKIETK